MIRFSRRHSVGGRGQGLVLVQAAFGDDLQERILPKGLVVVEIFVAQGDAEDPLGQKGSLLMDDHVWISRIRDTSVEGVDETEPLIDLPKQQAACIGGQFASVEVGVDFLAAKAGKDDGFHVHSVPQ